MLDKLRRRRFRRPRLSAHTRTRLDVTRHRLSHGLVPRVGELLLATVALLAAACRRSRQLAADTGTRGRAGAAAASTYGRELTTAVAEGRGREVLARGTRTGWHRWRRAITTGGGRRALAAAAAVAVLAVSMVGVQDTPQQRTTGDVTAATDAERQLAERRDATDRGDRGSRDGAGPEQSPTPDDEENTGGGDPAARALNDAGFAHPMPGADTTSCYGQRWGSLHAGVDLASPPGTPVHSVQAGTVTETGWVYGGYGISVVVDHHNGFSTHYAHLSETLVSPGDEVAAGEAVAREGNTGNSSGPHLHFEVHRGMWNPVEPTQWLANRDVHIPGC